MIANTTCYQSLIRAVVAYTLVLVEAGPLNSGNTGQTLFSTTAALQLAAWQLLPSRNKDDMHNLLTNKPMHNIFIQLQPSGQCMLMACLERRTQVWPTIGGHACSSHLHVRVHSFVHRRFSTKVILPLNSPPQCT
jgi:hypothetical protein